MNPQGRLELSAEHRHEVEQEADPLPGRPGGEEAALERQIALERRRDREAEGDRFVRKLRFLRLGIMEQPVQLVVAGEEFAGLDYCRVLRQRAGLLQEFLDQPHEVGSRVVEHPLHHESRATDHDDARPAVRQLLVRPDLRDAADRPPIGVSVSEPGSTTPKRWSPMRQSASICRYRGSKM